MLTVDCEARRPAHALSLREWWRDPGHPQRNPWVSYTTRTGSAEVYVKRCCVCPRVLEIGSINTTYGWGAAWSLYTQFTRTIPAVAEQILNPHLDSLLQRWGWSTVYRDLMGIPTRVNPAFMALCPRAADYGSHRAALKATLPRELSGD